MRQYGFLPETGREVESMALHVTSVISISIPFPALSERKNVECVGGISLVGDDAREVDRAVCVIVMLCCLEFSCNQL